MASSLAQRIRGPAWRPAIHVPAVSVEAMLADYDPFNDNIASNAAQYQPRGDAEAMGQVVEQGSTKATRTAATVLTVGALGLIGYALYAATRG